MEENIKIEDVSSVRKKISVSIPPDIVNQKIDEACRDLKGKVKIPGFRPGKVTASVIKRRFKKEILADISKTLVTDSYLKAVTQGEMRPVSNPIFNQREKNDYWGEFSKDNSYSVEFEVDVAPVVEPVGYKGLEYKVGDYDQNAIYEHRLKELRGKFATSEQIETGIQQGDSVVMDFKGYVDGEPFDGGEMEGFEIKQVGDQTLIHDFEQKLLGLKVGDEKRIEVEFPETYNIDFLAGNTAEFDVKIHSVIRKTPAEVDEDLALMAGFNSVDEMLTSLKAEAERAVREQERGDAENSLLAKLLESNKFDLPESLVMREANRLAKTYNINDPVEEVKNILIAKATDNLRKIFLLEAIFEKEERLEIDVDELSEFLEGEAAKYNLGKDEFMSRLNNSGQMDDFVGQLRMKKTVDFLIESNSKESTDVG